MDPRNVANASILRNTGEAMAADAGFPRGPIASTVQNDL